MLIRSPLRAHRTRGPLLTAVVLLVSLVLAACGGEPQDPQAALADAIDETFDGSFAYELTIDADPGALDALGEDAGQAAAFLTGFRLYGEVDGETTSANVEALGTDLLQLLVLGEEAFYVRLGVQDLLGLMGGGGFAAEDVVPSLQALGLSTEVQSAVVEGLQGSWVGIEGALDPERFAGLLRSDPAAPDDEEAEAAVRDAFGGDLPGFIERYVTVVEEVETEEGRTLTIALQLRDLLRTAAELNTELGMQERPGLGDLEADLADLPETIPGRVVILDGRIQDMVFAVADTMREAGTAIEGDLDIRFAITEHDDVGPIVAPEGASTLTAEQFQDALDTLASFAGPRLDG